MAEAVGLVVEEQGTALACFTGDLIRDPGVVVNLYDLEHAYGTTRLPELPAVLRWLADDVDTGCYLPATGPAMTDGRQAARALADKIDTFAAASGEAPRFDHTPEPAPALRKTGRFEQVGQGVWQFQQPGNPIVLIDPQGRGLMFDPGPCDYENANREQDFQADLIGDGYPPQYSPENIILTINL